MVAGTEIEERDENDDDAGDAVVVDGAGRPLPWGVVGRLAATGERARSRRDGTIERIAAPAPRARRAARPAPRTIQRAPRDRDLPLSFAQQRLWYLDQLEPGNAAYNNPVALRLSGPLDPGALERAINEVVSRHEVLRTRIAVADGRAAQQILPEVRVPLELVDLSGLPEAEREDEARRRARAEAGRPFALDAAPLVRAALLRLAPGEAAGEHVLLVTMHHIVSDGWSAGVLFAELGALYAAFAAGHPSPLPELAVQYADHAVWQRQQLDGPLLAGELAYWKERLADLPALELAGDHPRPPVPSSGGARQATSIAAPVAGALAALARDEGATPFMGLLAALQAVLHRYTAQTDFGVGTPVAGRNRPEVEPLVGCFVNTLVLRADLSRRPSFRELLRRVRGDALGAFAHQELPFERLVDALEVPRDLSVPALFQVMLVLHNTPVARAQLEGLRLEGIEVDSGKAKFDLTLELREGGGGFGGTFEYSTDLFDDATVERLARHFEAMVAAAVAEPERPIDDLPLLSAAEERQLLIEWNDTAAPYSSDACLHELFAAQAARTPDALAVVSPDEDAALTYAELDARAEALAAALRDLGVGPEDRVGLLIERSAQLVVGIVGALKAGATYVPLDPGHPPDRLALLLDDARVRALLTRRALLDRVPGCAAPVLCAEDWPPAGARHGATPAHPDAAAYVMYTSGSTGRPKGVAVPHRAVVRMIEGLDWGRRDPDEAVLMLAATVFDASSLELWSALLAGSRAVAYPPGPLAPDELGAFLRRHRITRAMLSAGVFHLMADQRPADLGGLQSLMVGGDVLSPPRARRVLEQFPDLHLLNGYGPTEAATTATAHRVEPGDARASIPIGRPIANTRALVLDGRMQPVPVGVPGELFVGGDALARGYLEDRPRTAAAFVPDPFGPAGARLYRTGDRARWRTGGTLEFLGRADEQVKVRGFRIEPGEVEAVLAEHPEVRECAVIARRDGGGERRLIAYVVANGTDPAELRAFLGRSLPDWMVPAAFVPMAALPLSPTGKLDRRALPAPDAIAGRDMVAPRDAAEETLAGVWAEVLGLPRVGVHDNFFDLGGDSILSIQVIARAREHGIELTPRQMFQHQTVAEQAAAAGTAAPVDAEQGVVSGPVPLTPIERWFAGRELAAPHHFNMSVLLDTPPDLDPAVIGDAVRALLEHHDALRLRLRRDGASWRQEIAPAEDADVLRRIDLSAARDHDAALARAADELQASLDLERGPLVRAALFERGEEPARLLLVAHHIATDVVSLRILLEDLSRAVEQLRRGEPVRLPPKTTSFKAWSERLVEHALSPDLAAQAEYWESQLAGDALGLPLDAAQAANLEASARRVTMELSEAETHALLHQAQAGYRVQVPELLVAAVAHGVARLDRPARAGDRSREPWPRGPVRGRQPLAHRRLVHRAVPGAHRAARRRGAGRGARRGGAAAARRAAGRWRELRPAALPRSVRRASGRHGDRRRSASTTSGRSIARRRRGGSASSTPSTAPTARRTASARTCSTSTRRCSTAACASCGPTRTRCTAARRSRRWRATWPAACASSSRTARRRRFATSGHGCRRRAPSARRRSSPCRAEVRCSCRSCRSGCGSWISSSRAPRS